MNIYDGDEIIVNEIENLKDNLDFDKLDTSWMSRAQKRFLHVLKDPCNRTKKISELIELAGYKSNEAWYTAFNDTRFRAILELINVKPRQNKYLQHYAIQYIENPNERKKYLENDTWDIRKLYKDYPRHVSPSSYIVQFEKINNVFLRKIIKLYFECMLGKWGACTFVCSLSQMMNFISVTESIFPNVKSFSELNRDTHMLKILSSMKCSNHSKKESLNLIRSMFEYMFINKWKDGPSEQNLIVKYDVPKKAKSLPKPIPPYVKKVLDNYIINVITPLLDNEKPTPIIKPIYWDMIIILSNTGIRFEDLSHLEENQENLEKDCMKYDADGDLQLFLDSRISKSKQELIIPLAHLNNINNGNAVEKALLRQKKRVTELSPCSDGHSYLFRKVIKTADGNQDEVVEVISGNAFKKILIKLCSSIPLKDNRGNIYKITAHQFRHTIATEMVNAGVGIYAIKEFLGHSNLDTTERYIKVYLESLKDELNKKLSQVYEFNNKVSHNCDQHLYDNKWIKNNILGVFELGDGLCEVSHTSNLCPYINCKTCIKRKVYPRHMQAVKRTLEGYGKLRENAISLGLIDKYNEFDEIIRFYTIALNIISTGEVFIASEHFYNERNEIND